MSELDAEKVEVGQKLQVIFPFSDRTIDAKVDYIDKAIDPDSRSAKFRTAIRNPDGKLKAGMFVRVLVLISPKEGRTLIPRAAMVTVDRFDYVFIRKPGKCERVRTPSDLHRQREPRHRRRRRDVAGPSGAHARARRCDHRKPDSGAVVRGPRDDRRRLSGVANRRNEAWLPSDKPAFRS